MVGREAVRASTAGIGCPARWHAGPTRRGRIGGTALERLGRGDHRTGEIFTEIGQSIVARSPFQHTLYATYANGTIQYVPTRAAYGEGGYEVTHACQVAPEAGEQIEEESTRLLRRIHDGI